tara:strand:- start:37 stop:393 length:357 start_codon:yes stop_codon:yes gene_type:complete
MLINIEDLEDKEENFRDKIEEHSPNSEKLIKFDKEMFDLVCQILRNPDRDFVCRLLKHNKPKEQHLMLWLESNLPINKLIFIDGHVKFRWQKDYFYELLSYSIEGNPFALVNYPRRKK